MKIAAEGGLLSYFEERMAKLGITPEINQVQLRKTNIYTHREELQNFQIFKSVDKGIEILVYDLNRNTIRVERHGSKQKKDYVLLRLEKPIIRSDGSTMKYVIPKGAGTHPFFPPPILEKFERKEKINTLFLTEGFFKAFKASMHGVDMVGLSSITHMKETGKNNIHPEILELMNVCQVERMVWLCDGDAADITHKELKDGADLRKRPANFFASVQTFKNVLSDFDVQKWFLYINTEAIWKDNESKKLPNGEFISRDDLKGIDDLLVSLPEKTEQIVKDLNSVSMGGYYFQKFDITYSILKVHQHFHLNNVNDFYFFHVDRRPELATIEFIFDGSRYKYDEDAKECKLIIPKETKFYFRVGDDYYKYITIPNQYNKSERTIQERKKGTIMDDHGKNFIKMIPKFEAFCNVPDHINFRPIIDNCFNVYNPIDYMPDDDECTEEDCPTIISFLKHLFGEKTVSYSKSNNGVKEKIEISTLDIALDYLQILYQFPQQKLPIICLVSAENNTGKTTFGNFLRIMLGANVAIVGNQDLTSDFNAHWAGKNVVICDEAKIDKVHVVEKIKMLSTARKIFMNAKGRGQVELDCFIKFVMISNNEDNFINITDQDIRFWIIKVPKLVSENPKLVDLLAEEMPAWLSFLGRRKMKTEMMNRMWFHPDLLRTEALKKVIANSQSNAEKELRHWLREMFLDTGKKEIRMSASVIHKEIFRSSQKVEPMYLSRVIKDKMRCEQYHVYIVDGVKNEYDSIEEARAVAALKFEGQEVMVESKISKKYKVIRYTYPHIEVKGGSEGKLESYVIDSGDMGRPYVFKRSDFVSEEESRSTILDPERSSMEETFQDSVTQEDPSLPF